MNLPGRAAVEDLAAASSLPPVVNGTDFDIMAGRHQIRSFPLPGVYSSGQVHALGNCTDSDVLEDIEAYELLSRGKEKM